MYLAFPGHGHEPDVLTLEKASMTAPLITITESLNSEDDCHEYSDVLMLYHDCSFEESVRRSMLIFTDTTIKNFIAQKDALLDNQVLSDIFPSTL